MKLLILASTFCVLTSSAFCKQHYRQPKVETPSFGQSQLNPDLLRSHLPIELITSHLLVPENNQSVDLIRLGGKKRKLPPITQIDDVLKATLSMRNLDLVEGMKLLPPRDRTQAMCLALNIYHEARGSTEEDQLGVGFVTLNRVNAMNGRLFGDTICKVVGQRLTRNSNPQFSWLIQSTNELVPYESEAWAKSQRMALRLYTNYCNKDNTNNDGCWKDITGGALFFWNPTIAKIGSWMKTGLEYTILGSHTYMTVAFKK